ncbi:MAG: acyltransferase [Sphingomonas sp.]
MRQVRSGEGAVTVTVDDRGQDNVLRLVSPEDHGSVHVTFRGSGNVVELGTGSAGLSARLDLGDDSRVTIGANVRMAALEVHTERGAHIRIGTGTALTWVLRIHAHEAADVTIGERCLISDDCWITVSDMHSILDKASGRRINPARPVVIGDHVWLSNGVTVLKGAAIGAGAVIGYGSVVTGAIPAETLAVGRPAKVVRSGIVWDEALL